MHARRKVVVVRIGDRLLQHVDEPLPHAEHVRQPPELVEQLGLAVGRAIAGSCLPRSELFVTTKLAIDDQGFQSSQDALKASLDRLGLEYVDLYLIHWPDLNTPIEETMETLNDLVRAGKTRYVGVSNHSAAQLREAKQTASICANQVGYNLFDRRWEREMFPTARALGIGVMAYGPMAHGLLTGTFTTETTFV